MKTFCEGKLHCQCTALKGLNKTAYILAPADIDHEYIMRLAEETQINITTIYGIDWENDLTPWPEPNATRGAAPYDGKGKAFLHFLETEVIPTIERAVGCDDVQERYLVGISLSGLFALWAWMHDDFFTKICTISGSFWYIAFTDWLQGAVENPICSLSQKRETGAAFFSLGRNEAKSRNPLFHTVEAATRQIVNILRGAGIAATLELNDGNHTDPICPRLSQAFARLTAPTPKPTV